MTSKLAWLLGDDDLEQLPWVLNGGHTWFRDEDGKIDLSASDGDWHNGPLCITCGYTFCIHCEPYDFIPPQCQLQCPL